MRQIPTNDGWRDQGEMRRHYLLEKDELEGSMNFSLSKDCSVTKYFKVADRVLDQFCSMYKNRTNMANMEEIYVRGHRLVAFLDRALPQHPQYDSLHPEISSMRQKSQTDLDWILKRLEIVALRIDEEQHNQHLMKGKIRGRFQQTRNEEAEWESFSGWTPVTDEDRAWEDGVVSFESSSDQSSSSNDMSMDYCVFPDMVNEKAPSSAFRDSFSNEGISVIEEEQSSFVPYFDSENVNNSNDENQWMSHKSGRQVHLAIINNGIRKPQNAICDDPPGLTMSFSRDKSFLPKNPSNEEIKSDRNGILVSPVNFEKQNNKIIRSVPSDESEIPPRRRVRFNEAGNQIKVYIPGERVTAI